MTSPSVGMMIQECFCFLRSARTLPTFFPRLRRRVAERRTQEMRTRAAIWSRVTGLAALLLTVPAVSTAQTYNSAGGITVSGTYEASEGSSVSVTNLSGTVSAMSVTLTNLDVTNLNSIAMVLVPPSSSGLKALDFFSGICGAGSQQIGNSTLTLINTGGTGTDNVGGMIPYLGGTCPSALSGNYVPSDYFPGQDVFSSPGPSTYNSGGIGSTACTSLNVTCGTYTFSTAFGLPASPSVLEGTWTLYIANQSPSGFTPSGTLGGWSITFTTESAAATTTSISTNNNGETSTVFTNGNVDGQSITGTPVTFTATVLSGGEPVTAGTVSFYDSTFSNPGILLASNVAVNSSSQAQATVTFPASEEGSRSITATYNGVANTYASSTAPPLTELTVNHPYNPSGATFCNGPVYINDNVGGLSDGTGGFPYPSQLVLGNSFSQLQGTIESVTVTLNGLQSEQPNFDGLLLQAPSGNAFEFMSWADGDGPGGSPPGLTNLNLTLSDTGSGSLQTSADDQEDCSTSPCRPADDYAQIGALYKDAFPSPAPSATAKAYPTGSATFTSQFGGGAANGTWLLYLNNWLAENPSSNSSLPYGEIGSWCLNFTMQANAHPTATSVSGSPNPASFIPPSTTANVTLTANVTVTDGSGLTVNAGTVTFVDGATTLGSPTVSNGQATLSVSLAEGTHQIVASYSGTNTGTEFGISTGTYDQRVDTATTNPSSGSGAGPYTYCNTGSITAPGLGLDAGAAAPYPSNIFVTNLPGTVDEVTVTLTGFSTKDQGDLLALLVGPGGNNLDFFSLTGSNVSTAPSPFNLTFSDTAASNVAEGSGGNLSSAGTFKPTSYNTNVTYPQCPPNASNCANPPVGPPLASNPFTPTNKAATAGTALLGNANAAGVFGGTSSSTYNGNGTWSLYVDDGGPTGGGELSYLTGGWCVSLTENLPSVTVTKSHSGTFSQGQQGVAFTVNITNNGPGPSGDPTGGRNPLTVTDTLNSAFAYAGFSGTGWSCSATGQTVNCTNDSSVAQGSSYGALTIDVNVSPTASTTTSISNSVQVSGGGVKNATSNTDSVMISPAPVLAVQKSHVGNFVQGQTAQWTITVSNAASGSLTYGTINLSDSLPANYTLASYMATGGAWSCSGSNTVTCSTTSGISGGANSTITLTVNVPANSPASVTNTVAAWGGGDLVHTSLGTAATASDTATVTPSQYVLTTAVSPAGSGTVTPTSGNLYNVGTVVPITATPAGGYAFVNWTSSPGTVANSTLASTTITMNAAETVTANFTAVPPGIYSPVNGSSLSGNLATFQWGAYSGATAYWLDVGKEQGGNEYYQSNSLSASTFSATVDSLPSDGSTVWARWYYFLSGGWQYSDYSYTAFGSNPTKGMMVSPVPNSTLSGTTVTFTWNPGMGATAYWIDAGSVAGGNQYFQSGNLGNVLAKTVTGLPMNGSPVYITLWSLVNNQWLYNEYSYTAFNLVAEEGVLTTPMPGSMLTSATVTFAWTANAGASAYWLDVGSTPGGDQYSQSGNLGNVLTTTVSGLPTDGSTIYVTLYSLVGSVWGGSSYTYTALNATSGLAQITSPMPGTTLSGDTVTFDWSADPNATAYWLDIGSVAGGNDVYQSGNLGNGQTTTVFSLPANGSTIYVTLYSFVGGQWVASDYTYVSGP
jgi:List-Bact-rpt repeat protein/Big-like domain-containing protein/uncharacterized protein DUF11